MKYGMYLEQLKSCIAEQSTLCTYHRRYPGLDHLLLDVVLWVHIMLTKPEYRSK